MKTFLVLAWAMIFFGIACTGFSNETTATQNAVFKIQNGKVLFPGYDDVSSHTRKALLTLEPKDFPGAHVYRNEVLLQIPPMISREFEIPAAATAIQVTGRSRPSLDIFPRLKISLTVEDKTNILFQGYWQTLSMETKQLSLPSGLGGKKVVVKIEILNPAMEDEQRTFYFTRATVE
jgi:hypothetical protein